MRILFVQPTGDKRGHYGLWTSKICQAIGKTRHDLHLITNKIYSEKYINEPLTFEVIEVDSGKFSFEKFDASIKKCPLFYWYGYYRNTFSILKAALNLCKKDKFDIIFLTDAEYLTASLLIKRYAKFLPPIIWHVQAANFGFNAYPGPVYKRFYKVIQREIFKSVIGKEIKAFVVMTDWHRDKLSSQLNLDTHFTVELLPDCAEIQSNLPDRISAREKIGIKYDGPVFLFLGILRKDKGIEYLLEAISYLKSDEFRVIIAGSPHDYTEKQINSLIRAFGISKKVILRLGYVPDEEIALYYSSCDAVIFPYSKLYTGGSGPLTKGACSHCKPVIVTDVSGMSGLVRQHKIGLIAEAENPKSIAEKMSEFILLSQEKKNELSINSSSVARMNSWDNVAKKFVKILEKVTAKI